MGNFFTLEEEEYAVTAYQMGVSSVKIGAALGRSGSGIQKILHRKGIPLRNAVQAIRTCTVDETVFDTITPESAYWIGFLMADGTITEEKRGSPKIRLEVAAKDLEHIKAYQRFLKSTHQMGYRAKTNAYALNIRSAPLVSAVKKYGVVPRKSLTARVSYLEDNLHFWRGAIDGDGCVHRRKGGYAHVDLCGSQALVTQFATFCKRVVPACTITVRPCSSIYRAILTGGKAVYLLTYLYDSTFFALQRKKCLASALIAEYAARQERNLSLV